jgi:DNA-binding NtrC family response regulator
MKLNVVVIDDSALQLILASKLIQKNEQLNLVGAYADPFLGLNAINTEKVDVVLLDVEMPEIDGFSLQKLFKNSVHVIVNSTRANFELQAYVNGAIDFIQKPLTTEKIEKTVTRIMEFKRLVVSERIAVNTLAS